MILIDLRAGARMLLADYQYAIVSIVGLALGFATFFLLASYVSYAYSFDSSLTAYKQMYVLKAKRNLVANPAWDDQLPLVLKDSLTSKHIGATSARLYESDATVEYLTQLHPVRLTLADSSIQELLDIKAAEGDLGRALNRPDAVAITQNVAKRIFGDQSAVGKSIVIAGQSLQVAAVVENPARATIFPYEILANIASPTLSESDRKGPADGWWAPTGRIILVLKDKGSIDQVKGEIQGILDSSPLSEIPEEYYRSHGESRPIDVGLVPLQDAYLDSSSNIHEDRRNIIGLLVVACLILATSVINYVTLATVKAIRRRREIGIRKAIGASSSRLAYLFFTESALVTLISAAIAVLLTIVLLPLLSVIFYRDLNDVVRPINVVLILAFSIAVGAMASAYPTWIAKRMPLAASLAGRGANESVGGAWLRKILSVIQITTAICFVGITFCIFKQTQFATTLSPGFDPSSMITVELSEGMASAGSRAFRDEVLKIPRVVSVGASSQVISRDTGHQLVNFNRPGMAITKLDVKKVSQNFFQTLSIAPLAGRVFNESIDSIENSTAAVISSRTATVLGYETPSAALDQTLRDEENGIIFRIVGVVPDIRYNTLRQPPQDTIFLLNQNTRILTVNASGSINAVKEDIHNLWRRHFPNELPKVSSTNDFFERAYADDVRLARILAAAAVVGILLASFGLYSFAAYSLRQKTKEIVLRKLFGSSKLRVIIFVFKEIAAIVAASALIALPFLMKLTEEYLSGYEVRAPVGGEAVFFALAVLSIVAVLSTARHLWAAIHIAPLQALKN